MCNCGLCRTYFSIFQTIIYPHIRRTCLCIFQTIFLFIATFCGILPIFVMLIVLFFFFWPILGPSSVKFHVTDASVTQFNYHTCNNTLYYNLKANITARNPNKHVMVYYRSITATAFYKQNAFASVNLAPFDQGHKNTSSLQQAVFEGHKVIDLTTCQIGEYMVETCAGIYNNLVVELDLRMRAKFGSIRSGRYNPPIVECDLRVPLISNGKLPPPFNVTRCSITGYFFEDRDGSLP